MYGPGLARYDDHGIAVYAVAGFAIVQADQTTATIFTFVLGNALSWLCSGGSAWQEAQPRRR